jgi:hypothetical protein
MKDTLIHAGKLETEEMISITMTSEVRPVWGG